MNSKFNNTLVLNISFHADIERSLLSKISNSFIISGNFFIDCFLKKNCKRKFLAHQLQL